jgi:hypothetical protein
MTTHIGNGRLDAGHARIAVVVALVGFVAYLAVPSGVRVAALVVMVAASCAVVVCAGVVIRTRSGSPAVAGVAAASSVGLVGSVLYLRSLADEPSAIPLAGTFVLLLSLIGLVTSSLLLRRPVSGRRSRRVSR